LEVETGRFTSPIEVKTTHEATGLISGISTITPASDRTYLTFGCYAENNLWKNDPYMWAGVANKFGAKIGITRDAGAIWNAYSAAGLTGNTITTWNIAAALPLWNATGAWVGVVNTKDLRFVPITAPTTTPEGRVYYDSTLDTLRYRDATQWNNFISEYGSVIIPAGNSTYRVNFRKAYASPPLVIATPVGTAEDMVFVRNYNLTNTYVDFDIDVWTGGGTFNGVSSASQEIQYVVIPR
jgi:hypothetical protein